MLGSILISFAAAAGALPTGYTQVDYIESTGSQYIDTGYVHTANTRAVCVADVNARQYATYAIMFGARNGDYKKNSSRGAFPNGEDEENNLGGAHAPPICWKNELFPRFR